MKKSVFFENVTILGLAFEGEKDLNDSKAFNHDICISGYNTETKKDETITAAAFNFSEEERNQAFNVLYSAFQNNRQLNSMTFDFDDTDNFYRLNSFSFGKFLALP